MELVTTSRIARLEKRGATYDDLVKVPDHEVAEIVGGDLYVSPRPAAPHALAAATLMVEIGGPFHRGRGGPGGWWILLEPELHLGGHVLVPDLAGWRRERMSRVPDAPALTVAPDWVCEVASPSTEKLDRTRKLPAYASQGVGNLWLVNPLTRTLEVYRRVGSGWLLVTAHADDALVRAEPFDALELDLLALWGEEREAAGPGLAGPRQP
jgi:Uma2 family endonuclease